MLLISKKWHTARAFESEDAAAIVRMLLNARGITDDAEVEEFLSDKPKQWHNPFLFCDMQKAVDIIIDSMNLGERILIYGDYDADGVTATSILVRYFRMHNCNIDYIVPHRAEHGYGLTDNIMEKIVEKKPQLLITVDCGITNIDTVKKVRDMGVKVIITDHHNVKDELPEAEAVICAKRADNTYPCKDLCGAGVALKLVEALGRNGKYKVSSNFWHQAVELAGIATIADLVPLVGENRTLVKQAFKSMQNPANLGVRKMNEMILGGNGKTLDETFISFNFVPRINAAGRLYDSSDSLKLFLEDDEKLVTEAVNSLTKQNDERKEIEAKVFAEAVEQLESPDRPNEWAITNTVGPLVVYGPDWHQGVLGIVAGKLSQHFRRSAIVFTNDSIVKDNLKGSGRSFGEFDLYSALDSVGDLCLNFGGHKKAAGLVVEKDKLYQFMRRLEDNSANNSQVDSDIDENVDWNDEDDSLVADVVLDVGQIDFDTYNEICKMKPFGIGNRKPTFVTRNVTIGELQTMSNGAHVRLDVFDSKAGNGTEAAKISVVGFNMGQLSKVLKVGDKVDIAYSLNEHSFKGHTSLSLHLMDIKLDYKKDFLWAKSEYAERLYRSGLELTELRKLANHPMSDLVPSDEQYGECYKILYNLANNELSTCDADLLARLITNETGKLFTPFQLMRCLDVFSEVGLINLAYLSDSRVCFSILQATDRKKLSDSATFQRMKRYVQQ
ncbi:MAG: single-stranded-DNA-specific exonuclease RecJ [Clostridia bacterium]|nr:single-stranded-DNA-specific exonuclease RecJ [Clostridia bacterium]